MLPNGEPYVRGRCGTRISFQPVGPFLPPGEEAGSEEFNLPDVNGKPYREWTFAAPIVPYGENRAPGIEHPGSAGGDTDWRPAACQTRHLRRRLLPERSATPHARFRAVERRLSRPSSRGAAVALAATPDTSEPSTFVLTGVGLVLAVRQVPRRRA